MKHPVGIKLTSNKILIKPAKNYTTRGVLKKDKHSIELVQGRRNRALSDNWNHYVLAIKQSLDLEQCD